MIIPASLLLGSVTFDLLANYCVKRSKGFKKKVWAAGSIIFIILAFVLLSFVVRYIPLGIAYAVWGSLGILGTVAIDRILFKSRLGRQGITGVAIIVIGIIILQI
ncbi:QacE family quaternary ammonium compound efflux SMR transporter [Oligella urethralis]|uniref:DMT family transporter n=1 Tax=Oligella urethralis TaxID=90245 RepID=UPI000D00FBFB|nr:SMR family transporter [Oligella urethralis]AVL71357.1 QacE family quaternary ammonium compound efflux SMR transporter [Oligella urethralis]